MTRKTFAGFDLEKVLRDDEERMRLEAERLTKKAAAAGKGGKPKTPPAVLRTPLVTPSPDFSITYDAAEKYFRIGGVEYRGNKSAYDLSAVFDKDDVKTQDQWAEHTKNNPDDFGCGAAGLYYALMRTLYANRNGTSKAVVEQARVHLAAVFAVSNPYIMTLTRAVYNPGGLDDVIHDYGLLSRKQQQLTLVGSNGYIKAAATQADDAVHALLETSDSISGVNDIFRWVMGKDAYLYRINQALSSKEERLVVLGAVGDVSVIVANGSVDDSRPLLGVRSSAKKSTP